jgi:hypothetical protein
MNAIWDREPMWDAVKGILERNGACTAGEITDALVGQGWEVTPEYRLSGRVYQLLRERTITGEVVRFGKKGSRAGTYGLAAGMPKGIVHYTQEEYADLHRIAKKLRISPQELAGRILGAGIAYMKKVVG